MKATILVRVFLALKREVRVIFISRVNMRLESWRNFVIHQEVVAPIALPIHEITNVI